MASKIEWTEETWNPVTGCTKISAGCKNCYAERMAKRLRGRHGYPADEPFRVTSHRDKLDQPRRWKKPRRVFVCSMGDLFHSDLLSHYIDKVMADMWKAPQHTFQVLTKRPARASQWKRWPFNVWLGTSVENQKALEKRWPWIEKCNAYIRFLSLEPLLAPIDLSGMAIKPDWAIIGCESGPGARPCELDWIRKIKDQCVEHGVPVFIKQARIDGKLIKMPKIDGRVWDQYPEVADG